MTALFPKKLLSLSLFLLLCSFSAQSSDQDSDEDELLTRDLVSLIGGRTFPPMDEEKKKMIIGALYAEKWCRSKEQSALWGALDHFNDAVTEYNTSEAIELRNHFLRCIDTHYQKENTLAMVYEENWGSDGQEYSLQRAIHYYNIAILYFQSDTARTDKKNLIQEAENYYNAINEHAIEHEAPCREIAQRFKLLFDLTGKSAYEDKAQDYAVS